MAQRSLFLFILAGVLCAMGAESLQASCGDWLLHPAADTAASQLTAEAPAPLTRPPCQGPHCGRSPAAPLSPPLPVVERHHDGVACLERTSACSQPNRRSQVAELTFFLPLSSRQRIDRPPILGHDALV